jgi:hypothetical protein
MKKVSMKKNEFYSIGDSMKNLYRDKFFRSWVTKIL